MDPSSFPPSPPGQAQSWASWTWKVSLPGVGARPEEGSVKRALLEIASEGEVGGAFNPPPIPRGQEGPGIQSSRISKVAAQGAGSQGQMSPRTPGPELCFCLHLEGVLWLVGVQGRQDVGNTTRNQGCMGFESKDSSEVFAWEEALNPHKLH